MVKNLQITILQGPPGSGKSTRAREIYKTYEEDTCVIVNKDDIRNMFGTYWVYLREPLVKTIEQTSIYAALLAGYHVIVDATNMKEGHIETIRQTALKAQRASIGEHRNFSIDFTINMIEIVIPYWKAVWRDFWRGVKGGRRVGPKVIKSFYKMM